MSSPTSPTDLPAVFDGTGGYKNKYGQPESSSVSAPSTGTDQTARDAAAAALTAAAGAVPKWQPLTVYNSGDAVLNPFGQLVTAKTGFTSGSVYSAANWNDPLASIYDPAGTASAAVTALVNAAPGALDTLKELADALGDDANYAATVTAALAGKAPVLTATGAKTGNYAAAANELVPVDATGGVVTVTLPTAPADKTRVTVKKIDASANVVTVARGGSSDVFNKAGGATSASLTLANQAISVQYVAASGLWLVVSDDLPLMALLASTDSRYVGYAGTPRGDLSALGVFLPEAHGALGDGVTDDHAAIDAADAAANAAGGGRVYFNARTYLSSPLKRRGKVAWIGVHDSTTTIKRNPANTDDVPFVSLYDVNSELTDTRNICFDANNAGPGGAASCHGIYLDNTGGVFTNTNPGHELHSVRIKKTLNNGFHLSASTKSVRSWYLRVDQTGGHGVEVDSTDNYFFHPTISSAGAGFHGLWNNGANNHYVEPYAYFCGTQGTNSDGIHSTGINAHFIAPFGQDNGRAGFYIAANSDYTNATGVRTDGNGDTGIIIDTNKDDGAAESLKGLCIDFTTIVRTTGRRYNQPYGVRVAGTGSLLGCNIRGTAGNNATADVGSPASAFGTTSTVLIDAQDATGVHRMPGINAPLFIRKLADQVQNNNAAQTNDTELTLAVEANSVYEVDLAVIYSATTTADFKMSFTQPAGATIHWSANSAYPSITSIDAQIRVAYQTNGDAAAIGGSGTAQKLIARPKALLVTGGAAGSLTFRWAQSTAEVSDATVYAGSTMRATKVA